MPGGDGTGPLGLGPMTGRAAGYCVGFGAPGYANLRHGRGFWKWGRSRGRRRWPHAATFTGWSPAVVGWPAIAPAWPARLFGAPHFPGMTREQEIHALKSQAQYVADVLDSLRRRLEQLAPKSSEV